MSNKTDREALIFEWFLDAFKEARITNVVHKDSPDFRFEFCERNVGLEVTEIYQDSDSNGSVLKQRSSFGAKFTEEVIAQLQCHIPFTFGIGIVFNHQHHIKASKRKAVQGNIVALCLPMLNILQNKQHVKLDWYDNIPVEISRITLSRYDGLQASINKMPESGGRPSLTDSDLQATVDSKEELLDGYSPCDEYWLLIREGDYLAGSFSDLELKKNIVTQFDRVYLLRTKGKQELIRLQ